MGIKRVNPDRLTKACLCTLVVFELQENLPEVVVCLCEAGMEGQLLPEMLCRLGFPPLAGPDNSQRIVGPGVIRLQAQDLKVEGCGPLELSLPVEYRCEDEAGLEENQSLIHIRRCRRLRTCRTRRSP